MIFQHTSRGVLRNRWKYYYGIETTDAGPPYNPIQLPSGVWQVEGPNVWIKPDGVFAGGVVNGPAFGEPFLEPHPIPFPQPLGDEEWYGPEQPVNNQIGIAPLPTTEPPAPPNYWASLDTGILKQKTARLRENGKRLTAFNVEEANVPMDINKTTLNKIIRFKPITPLDAGHAELKLKEFILLFEIAKLKVPVRLDQAQVLRNSDATVGIEIELERCESRPASPLFGDPAFLKQANDCLASTWKITKDDSLRGEFPYEFVTRAGLQAKDVPHALAILNLYLFGIHGKAEANYRCGTHVHVGVANMTVAQYINMLFLYVLFEKFFYAVSGNRHKNIFCVPIREAVTSIENLVRLVHANKPTYDDFRRAFHGFKKYMAYNLLPSGPTYANGSPLGTVEFRHHQGEKNPTVLVPWIQYILDIHHAAQALSFEEIKELIFGLNTKTNYLQFAAKVFGAVPTAVSRQELINDMYEGSAFLKEIYLNSKERE